MSETLIRKTKLSGHIKQKSEMSLFLKLTSYPFKYIFMLLALRIYSYDWRLSKTPSHMIR